GTVPGGGPARARESAGLAIARDPLPAGVRGGQPLAGALPAAAPADAAGGSRLARWGIPPGGRRREAGSVPTPEPGARAGAPRAGARAGVPAQESRRTVSG